MKERWQRGRVKKWAGLVASLLVLHWQVNSENIWIREKNNVWSLEASNCVKVKINLTICLVSKQFKVNSGVFTVKSTQSEYNRLTSNSCVGNMINIGLLKYNKECQSRVNQVIFGASPVILYNFIISVFHLKAIVFTRLFSFS